MTWFDKMRFAAEQRLMLSVSSIVERAMAKWQARIAAKQAEYYPTPAQTVQFKVVVNEPVQAVQKQDPAQNDAKKLESAGVITVDFTKKNKRVFDMNQDGFEYGFEEGLRNNGVSPEDIRKIMKGIHDKSFYDTLEHYYKTVIDIYHQQRIIQNV